MSTKYEVPLTAEPQILSIQLGAVTYQLTVKWNDAAQCWVVDFADTNGNNVLTGIPLVTGVDLLSPYPDLAFGGTLTAVLEGSEDPPTYDSLGDTGHVYFTVT